MSRDRRILLKPKAKADLELIYVYTESIWGINQADKYIDLIYDSMMELSKFPEIRTKYFSAGNEYRKDIAQKHVIDT